jgi:hypothetical protein
LLITQVQRDVVTGRQFNAPGLKDVRALDSHLHALLKTYPVDLARLFDHPGISGHNAFDVLEQTAGFGTESSGYRHC